MVQKNSGNCASPKNIPEFEVASIKNKTPSIPRHHMIFLAHLVS